MYTYIIESQGLYKIGKAKNVDKRLSGYKTHNPMFKLIKVIDGDYEDQLHTVHWKKRSHLEWFNLTQEDIDNVEKDIIRDAEKDRIDKVRRSLSPKLVETASYVNLIQSARNREDAMQLGAGALRMYAYIIYSVDINSGQIALSPKQYEQDTGRGGSRNSYKDAIKELIATEYITNTNTKYVYNLNPEKLSTSAKYTK